MNIQAMSVACLLGACAVFGAEAGEARQEVRMAAPAVALNIPSGPLADALNSLAKQTGADLVYRADQVAGLRTSGVKGEYTTADAIGKLLEGTSLRLTINAAGAYLIAVPKTTAQGGPADQMRVATAGAGAQGASASDSAALPGRADVIVDGKRGRPAPFSTANLDLTRTEDDALPFTVFSAQDIQLSGATDLEEFFRNRLPQNFSDALPDEIDGQGINIVARRSGVNIRGWGSDETVFLLNGRRMPREFRDWSSTDGSDLTPEFRGVPLGSIERIEILSSAGSAIYGESATGGVINIITREDFRGGQLSVSYESPADVHRPQRGVDLSVGMPWKWGTGVRLVAGYSERLPMQVKDRSEVTIERWRRAVLERDPARLMGRTLVPPVGATPNIRSATTTASANLFGPLGGTANFTTVPAGYTGGGGLAAFAGTQGIYNLDLAEGKATGSTPFAYDAPMGVVSTYRTLGIGIDKRFGEHWRWSLDYRYSGTVADGRSSSGELSFTASRVVGTSLRVPANALHNPFNQQLLVRMIDPYMSRPELMNESKNTTAQFSTTLRGEWGAWRAYFDASYADNRTRAYNRQFHEPLGGWINAFVTGAYNPFVDPRAARPAAPDFYENYVMRRTTGISGNRDYQFAIKASGPVAQLPAGGVELTVGVDASRLERNLNYFIAEFVDPETGLPAVPFGTSSSLDGGIVDNDVKRNYTFDTYAAYAETAVPLLSARQALPGVHHLELFGSGRISQQVRKGAHWQSGNPLEYTERPYVHALGMRYSPVEGVMLRLSRSIGFRPPDFTSVAPRETLPTSDLVFSDPLRNGEEVRLRPEDYMTGGNPDLKPETTVSHNIGLVLAPRWLPGLRLSLDYLENVRNDAITGLNGEDLILYGIDERIRRAPSDGAGQPGPVIYADLSAINFNEISSRSLDVSLSQRIRGVRGGDLVVNMAATRNLSLKYQFSSTVPPEQQVRNPAATPARQIAWGGNLSLSWEGPQWTLGWSARYFDSLRVAPADYVLQGAAMVAAEINHDVFARYRMTEVPGAGGPLSWLSGTAVTFGMKNVFDREPRFWAKSTNRGVAPFDSAMGRTAWLQMRRDFY